MLDMAASFAKPHAKGARLMQQLALPLSNDPAAESALRRAWQNSHLRQPFHVALATPAIAICLRRAAEADLRRQRRKIHCRAG